MGGEASPGYNLVIGADNHYQSSLGTDQPGTIEFQDATHFVFHGGFLDGDSGTYTPGTIDYHTPDRAALFGCYPHQ
jgi:hypothetical protein